MNPQPDPEFFRFAAFLVMLWFVLTCRIGWSMGPREKPERDWSLFKLGEIYDESPSESLPEQTHNVQVSFTQTKPVKRKKPQKPDPKSDPLYNDCVDALHSLGYKKRESQSTASSIFNTSKPASVQEFLQIVFSRKS